MADNTAGQTRVGSNDQVTGGFAAGKITYDSTTITATEYTRVECGFQPRYIYWLNLTDRITVEWQEGFTSAQCMKSVAAGDKTLDTTAAAVVVDKQGFRILQDATLAAVLASKVIYWRAFG